VAAPAIDGANEKQTDMKLEIIGGSKKWRDALRKKIAEELDPKGVLGKPKKKQQTKSA